MRRAPGVYAWGSVILPASRTVSERAGLVRNRAWQRSLGGRLAAFDGEVYERGDVVQRCFDRSAGFLSSGLWSSLGGGSGSCRLGQPALCGGEAEPGVSVARP